MTIDAEGLGAVALGNDDRARVIAAIKAHLRIERQDEDDLIAAIGDAAIGLAEQFLGQVLIARTIRLTLPVRGGWQGLGVAPVRAIAAAAGVASDGSVTALPVVGYDIDITSRGDGWVRLVDAGGAAAVQVTCSAGLASDWTALAAPIRQGVVVLAGYLFRERDATGATPAEILALWRPFRRVPLAAVAAP